MILRANISFVLLALFAYLVSVENLIMAKLIELVRLYEVCDGKF